MTFESLASIDLNALSKAQLKSYVKLAREEWGHQIDLRSANIHDLIEYLQMYLRFKAESENSISCAEPEAIAPQEAEVIEAELTHTLSDLPELLTVETETLKTENNNHPINSGINDINRLVYLKADGYYFDTVSHKSSLVPNPDWLIHKYDASRYLDMNARSRSDFFTTAEPVYPLVYDHETPSFNEHARNAINALLRFGTYHGNEITTGWLSGVLRDCMIRNTKPERVKEMMLLSDDVYYSLVGIDPLQVKVFKNLVANAGAFNVQIPTPKEISQNLINVYGIDFSCQISIYHQMRENMWHLQQLCGISSLHEKHFAIRDKLFSAQEYDHQLIVIDADRIILKKDAFRTTQYFKELTHDYTLFVENLDNEESEPAPTDLNILNLGLEADDVWLRSQSIKWGRQTDGNYRSVDEYFPLEPDKIELTFLKWNNERYDYDSTYKLVAVHRDNRRFPWLAE